ncbi:DNA-binding transcriptional LysR family regulator [Spinactinospora alkalitolerans]|uniref:DNA-binding transcriptional LysR family regulator n=1 Tax=Spinactinospora alkalitolerans TaxID=687207 RepID=A0A852TVW5_9ACTN|nr:LysR family transcriptional regulator [Spinactinospora alkalitolerans]NYE48149.1 DNA-binding transcriptional LysR family regulator [Spinactinospora alkalitolerans]
MNLSLRQLEAYAAVARAESFTAAARELRVAQSSLSRTVLELERILGVRLFDRTTRSIRRTPEGEELLLVAERVLTAHRAEMTRLERYLAGERGGVTVATLPSIAAVLLPPVIAEFRARQPGIGVRILDGMSDLALRRVESGAADLAITIAHRLPGGLRSWPLVEDRFFAVLPARHARAGDPALRWSDFDGLQFIAIGADSSVRTLTDRAFAAADVRPAGVIEAGNVSTVGGLLAAGLGVSALPALVRVLMSFADHAHLPLTDPVVDRRLSVVLPAHRSPTPAAARFLDLLRGLKADDRPLPDDVRWV